MSLLLNMYVCVNADMLMYLVQIKLQHVGRDTVDKQTKQNGS